jgi:hypothetical protein
MIHDHFFPIPYLLAITTISASHSRLWNLYSWHIIFKERKNQITSQIHTYCIYLLHICVLVWIGSFPMHVLAAVSRSVFTLINYRLLIRSHRFQKVITCVYKSSRKMCGRFSRPQECYVWTLLARCKLPGEAVTLYTCIQEVVGSNLGRNTGHLVWSFVASSVPPRKSQENKSIRLPPVPSTSF